MQFLMHTAKQIGQLLQSARKGKRLTQAQVARAIGVGQPRLSSLETTRAGSLTVAQFLSLTATYGLEIWIQEKGSKLIPYGESEW